MSTMNAISECFGFHTKDTVFTRNYTEKKEKSSALNLMNGAGYIPVIGIGTCVVRCMAARSNRDMSMPQKVTMVARGLIEAIGLGLLFLIPDIIVSIGRHFCNQCRPEAYTQHRRAYTRETYRESYS